MPGASAGDKPLTEDADVIPQVWSNVKIQSKIPLLARSPQKLPVL